MTIRAGVLHWARGPSAQLVLRGAVAAMAAAALALTSVVALAQEAPARERPSKPNFDAVYLALQGEFSEYRSCVDAPKREAIATMWERQAPIDAAIYDISHAYRGCANFTAFWGALYFAGFDSPEQWIELELRALKTAAMAHAETDVQTMRDARGFIRKAWERVPSNRTLRETDKAFARESLFKLMYVVDALRPRDGDAQMFESHVSSYADVDLAFLPEHALEDLGAALEFAQQDERDPDQVLKTVKQTMRR